MALYDAQVSKVLIYRFDESLRNIDWTGVEIMLEFFFWEYKYNMDAMYSWEIRIASS